MSILDAERRLINRHPPRFSKLPQDRPIVAVCRSGNHSSVALTVLTRAGFTNVPELRGGMLAWARSGLPTKRGK